ncbi:unnamed protein product [Rotaria magnacalcarata]|uniref:Uncharacterized protein n=2 Tax=Rotaria magnacalcarata TaxID=392030 RepID=A0A816V963_9BILA|nr:unnamed protein product [Rotaria magnacalcarata]CAF2153968.1 unnamed protein product [Rotaria magnacalcarata]CAF3897472.1 unnamed protein product [Rotaria magnacalcarata]
MPDRNSFLPNNILNFQNDEFYGFVKHFSGEKLAILLQFRDINNVQCLLDCDDPFEILLLDSDDLLDLKKKICVKLNNNTFVVLPGIKSKMQLLKAALTKKRNELRREMSKPSSNPISTNNTSFTILLNSSNEQSTIISSSIASNSKSDDEQKQDIINLIDEWCKKMKEENNKQDFHLKESIDYEIVANYMLNKASVKCQCGITATLGIKSNNYILSHYIRHLTKSNSCTTIRQKLENFDGNVSLDNASNIDTSNTVDYLIISDNSNSTLFSQTVVGKRRKNQSSRSSLRKKKKLST